MKSIISIFTILLTISASVYGQEYERYKTLSDTLLYSESLGFDKKISLTVPFEYQGDVNEKSFPLIIVFDSQNQRSYNYIIRTIDYLTSNEQMPASIIIGVESTSKNRYKETQFELSDKDAFGSKNERFIFDELIPFAQNNLRANNFNLLIGHSRYGYFTSFLLTKYFEELNAVIALSPFMHQKNVNLTDSLVHLYTNYVMDKHLYYRFGIGNDYPEDFNELNSKLNMSTQANERINFKGVLFEEAGHTSTPGLAVGSGLYDVFEFWSKQQNTYMDNDNRDISSFNTLSDHVTGHYGVPLKFSLGTLNGKGWSFFNESEYTLAIDAWKKMMQEYPAFSEGYLYIVAAQKELDQDYTETLKQLERSLETTQFYSEEDLIEFRNEIQALKK